MKTKITIWIIFVFLLQACKVNKSVIDENIIYNTLKPVIFTVEENSLFVDKINNERMFLLYNTLNGIKYTSSKEKTIDSLNYKNFLGLLNNDTIYKHFLDNRNISKIEMYLNIKKIHLKNQKIIRYDSMVNVRKNYFLYGIKRSKPPKKWYSLSLPVYSKDNKFALVYLTENTLVKYKTPSKFTKRKEYFKENTTQFLLKRDKKTWKIVYQRKDKNTFDL